MFKTATRLAAGRLDMRGGMGNKAPRHRERASPMDDGRKEMVTQAESGRTVNVAKMKEWLTLASLLVVVVGGLVGGLRLVVSSAMAPLRADIQEINGRLGGIDGRLDGIEGRLDRMDARMDRTDARMDRIETDVATLRADTNEGFRTVGERLTRIETLLEILLERDADEPAGPDASKQSSP